MITFTTPSSAPVRYLQADAKRLLRIIGKDENAPQGIITAEQLPAARAAIEQAIAREEAAQADAAPPAAPEREGSAEGEGEQPAPIALRSRAMPLTRMLQAAQEAGDAVVWQA
ncbi:MAG: DUF1840 domain-containing protein [Comamonadaceae bacterium]|nr:DUF1840 domain-containing protein [Comamonadaceae bacterium]